MGSAIYICAIQGTGYPTKDNLMRDQNRTFYKLFVFTGEYLIASIKKQFCGFAVNEKSIGFTHLNSKSVSF